ncbi:MAG: pyruvate, phosphate dikinase, partial [Bacteroidales bacterium]|nr:pyruvate, phosphate dikinase [Bacteroidales bacterium]
MKYQLSQYYKNTKSNRDIFQELMAFKVKEILLVANLYDSYSVAREGEFFDRIEGEYRQLNLYAAPRITNVSTHDDAMTALQENKTDMVILMAGLDKTMPLELATQIKKKHPDLAILLLVNNNSHLKYFRDEGTKSDSIDRVFVWNGDSKVFLAMTKYVEDKKNVANDTRIGDVRIILLVEDSIRYYTRYLPILYSILMMQTQDVVKEHSVDDLHKILKMRGRPKILLAANYEEAKSIVQQFGNNLLCVISDMTFEKEGKKVHNVGKQLLQEIQKELPVPCLMQSADYKNKKIAKQLGVDFLWKDSESLSHEILSFLTQRCGFGDFVFKNKNGKRITQVASIEDFTETLRTIPMESILYHSDRQGISVWFMAHSEINLAKQLRRHRMNLTP